MVANYSILGIFDTGGGGGSILGGVDYHTSQGIRYLCQCRMFSIIFGIHRTAHVWPEWLFTEPVSYSMLPTPSKEFDIISTHILAGQLEEDVR